MTESEFKKSKNILFLNLLLNFLLCRELFGLDLLKYSFVFFKINKVEWSCLMEIGIKLRDDFYHELSFETF